MQKRQLDERLPGGKRTFVQSTSRGVLCNVYCIVNSEKFLAGLNHANALALINEVLQVLVRISSGVNPAQAK